MKIFKEIKRTKKNISDIMNSEIDLARLWRFTESYDVNTGVKNSVGVKDLTNYL